jgi:hypothetical protein
MSSKRKHETNDKRQEKTIEIKEKRRPKKKFH